MLVSAKHFVSLQPGHCTGFCFASEVGVTVGYWRATAERKYCCLEIAFMASGGSIHIVLQHFVSCAFSLLIKCLATGIYCTALGLEWKKKLM